MHSALVQIRVGTFWHNVSYTTQIFWRLVTLLHAYIFPSFNKDENTESLLYSSLMTLLEKCLSVNACFVACLLLEKLIYFLLLSHVICCLLHRKGEHDVLEAVLGSSGITSSCFVGHELFWIWTWVLWKYWIIWVRTQKRMRSYLSDNPQSFPLELYLCKKCTVPCFAIQGCCFSPRLANRM